MGAGPVTYMMDGDHTIQSREDTGYCANYNTDTYGRGATRRTPPQ
eukprot:COSAG01_NODE_47560_length_389_cov_0.806897_1_plen_45_part_00